MNNPLTKLLSDSYNNLIVQLDLSNKNNNTKQDNAIQDNAMQDNAMQDNAMQDNANNYLTDKEFVDKILYDIDKISSNDDSTSLIIDLLSEKNALETGLINNNTNYESLKETDNKLNTDEPKTIKLIDDTINNDNEKKILFDTLVFSGGGLRGFTYIGTLCAFEEYDMLKNIKTYAGSSIGSIMAAVVAVGYTSHELHDFILHFDYKDVKDINLLNFIKNYGIDSGNRIQLFIRLLLKKKTGLDDLTFLQLYEKTGNRLIITATCLNDRKLELFDYLKTPNLSIAKAIRMSISLPFILQTVSHNDKMYIDGGLLNNFPIHIFDHNQKILGVELADNKSGSDQPIPINNFEEYLHSIWSCIYSELFRIRSQIDTTKDIQILTIVIDWMSPLQLTLNLDEKQKLYDIGYKKTKKFLDKLQKKQI